MLVTDVMNLSDVFLVVLSTDWILVIWKFYISCTCKLFYAPLLTGINHRHHDYSGSLMLTIPVDKSPNFGLKSEGLTLLSGVAIYTT